MRLQASHWPRAYAGLLVLLLSHPSFSMKGSVCVQLSHFLSELPASRILEVQQPLFILYSLCASQPKSSMFTLI